MIAALRQRWQTLRDLAQVFPRFCREEPRHVVELVVCALAAAICDVLGTFHGLTCFLLGGGVALTVWRIAMVRVKVDREAFRASLEKMQTHGAFFVPVDTELISLERGCNCHEEGAFAACPIHDAPDYDPSGEGAFAASRLHSEIRERHTLELYEWNAFAPAPVMMCPRCHVRPGASMALCPQNDCPMKGVA